MSVIVKGMKMPKNCTRCDYIGLNVAIGCPVMSGTNGRAADCPLVALPDHHGDLIDRDEFKETLDYYIREAGWSDEHNEALTWVKDDFIDAEMIIVEAEDSE